MASQLNVLPFSSTNTALSPSESNATPKSTFSFLTNDLSLEIVEFFGSGERDGNLPSGISAEHKTSLKIEGIDSKCMVTQHLS